VFQTTFIGKGIERFGDIPTGDGYPPIANAVKKMVLHLELPINGGHILMGTDDPGEMGFTPTRGIHMHICVEPGAREEAQRIFDALAAGGTVIMPLQDMFFGSFFGQLSDKFGINWMLNVLRHDHTSGPRPADQHHWAEQQREVYASPAAGGETGCPRLPPRSMGACTRHQLAAARQRGMGG
jgi:uncharacterized glyoxalase superfamily protein PhnB